MVSKGDKPKAKKQTFTKETAAQKKKRLANETKQRDKSIKLYTERIETLLNKNDEFKTLSAEQICYAVWSAQPKSERGTVEDFAKAIGVGRTTLWKWRHLEVIRNLRFEIAVDVYKERTPNVLDNLTSRAEDTDKDFNAAPYINTFLKFVENWTEGTDPNQPDIIVNFGFNPSKHIQPEDAQAPKKSLSQMKGKEVGEILGKKAYKAKRMKKAAVTVAKNSK